MNALQRLLSRLRGPEAGRFDRDLHDQMDGHLDEAAADYMSQGLSPAEARRAALRSFGNRAVIEEVARDLRGRWLEQLGRDLRYGWRSLWRRPSFAAIAIVSLGLGLGANVASFAMIDRLVLRPFAIPNVDRLVLVKEDTPGGLQQRDTVAAGIFRDWPAQATSLQDFSAFTTWNVNLAGGDQPERIDGQRVTAGFFPLLGVTPALGRLLQPGDETWGRHRQIVISDGLWRRRFAADPGIVGRTIQVDGQPYVVVGVAPARFDFPAGSEAWAPLALQPEQMVDRSRRFLTVVARLAPGADVTVAQAELATIYGRQQQADPAATRGRDVVVRGFTEGLIDFGMPTALALQQAAAVFVLLIVCANVASLLLARGAERHRELAVRLALGANRRQLVRQLLVESLVLAAAAVPLALGTAWAVIQVMRATLPTSLVRYTPGWTEMGLDGRLIVLTVLAASITTVVFGLLPALTVSRVVPTGALKDGGRSMTAGRARNRLRRGFVVVELTLVVPLLVVAGLSAIAAHRFATGPQGFNPDGTYQFRVSLPTTTYPDQQARRQFADELVERARMTPGVTEAALTTVLPSSSTTQFRQISIDGVPVDPASPLVVNYRAISPAYFATMQIPLVAGRAFTPADRDETERVSIVTESFVRTHLANGPPLGRRIRLGSSGDTWATIVGVSADTIDDWFATRRQPTLFVPFAQFPGTPMTLVGRTAGDPTRLAGSLRAALAEIDPTLPSYDAGTVQELVRLRTMGLRFIAAVMAALGGLALLLSAFGVYGIMSHFVAERRHEFGLRMALGASAREVLALATRQGATLTAIGITLGLVAAIGLARMMEAALFGTVALDWRLLTGIALVLAAAALLASVLPARRAMKLDPAVVLRE